MAQSREDGDNRQSENVPFAGFAPPRANWTRVPNALFDELHRFRSKAELACVLYILRHTLGYNEPIRHLTLDEFENGRKRRNGTRMDAGVGMGRKAIIDGLRAAVEDGFISVLTDTSDAARIVKSYAVRFNGPED